MEGRGLEAALDGCATAYYLVHSMDGSEPGGRRPTAASRAATGARRENFARAARAAGVERIVYLGGIMPPPDAAVSAHLASRLEVEATLLDAVPGSTALRASIMIGAGCSSFRILVRLVERLRLLPLPAWRRNRTQPIDERDAIEYLARTPLLAATRRSVARHRRPGRALLRRDDRADRGADGRRPDAAPDPASVTPAASPW